MLSNFIRIFTAIAVITALLSGCAAQKKEESLPEASQPTYEEQSYYYYDEQTTETTQEYYEEETTEEAEIFFHNALGNSVIDEQDGTEFFSYYEKCDVCGYESSSKHSISHSFGTYNSSFFCPQCQESRKVEIETNKK